MLDPLLILLVIYSSIESIDMNLSEGVLSLEVGIGYLFSVCARNFKNGVPGGRRMQLCNNIEKNNSLPSETFCIYTHHFCSNAISAVGNQSLVGPY